MSNSDTSKCPFFRGETNPMTDVTPFQGLDMKEAEKCSYLKEVCPHFGATVTGQASVPSSKIHPVDMTKAKECPYLQKKCPHFSA